MKKILIFISVLILLSVLSYAITIDGSTTGDSYGAATATGSDTGWAAANLKSLFVTADANSEYFCVTGSNLASWEAGVLYIYSPGITAFSGTNETDQWSRQIKTNWSPNQPNVQVHMKLDNSWVEITIWNGSSWKVTANTLPHAINLSGGSANGFEVAIPKSMLGITGNQTIQVEGLVTGDQNYHGCFDSIPNGVNADAWDITSDTGDKTGPNNETVFVPTSSVKTPQKAKN